MRDKYPPSSPLSKFQIERQLPEELKLPPSKGEYFLNPQICIGKFEDVQLGMRQHQFFLGRFSSGNLYSIAEDTNICCVQQILTLQFNQNRLSRVLSSITYRYSTDSISWSEAGYVDIQVSFIEKSSLALRQALKLILTP